MPDSGFDPVLGRSISVAQATPAAGTPIRPQGFTCGSLEGQGLWAGCCTQETLPRASTGLGYRLHWCPGCQQGRVAPGGL